MPMNIPCGCDTRKEIMFEHGGFGRADVLVILIPLMLLGVAIYVKSHSK